MKKRIAVAVVLALVLSGCNAIHNARYAVDDRAICEREGYGGDSPEYRQCRADLVKKRAEDRQFAMDYATCRRKGITPNTPEFDDCRAKLEKTREDSARLMRQPPR